MPCTNINKKLQLFRTVSLFLKQKHLILAMVLIIHIAISAKEKVKYDGYISTGVEYIIKEIYSEVYYKGKMEFKIQLDNFIEGTLDFRGRSVDKEVDLKAAFVRFAYWPRLRIKVGRIKKRFGLEELVSKEKLVTIEESLMNRYLAPFGYVVRGTGIDVYQGYKGNGSPYGFHLGCFYNESHHNFFLGRFTRYGTLGFDQISINGIYRLGITQGLRDYFALSLDLSRNIIGLWWECEMFYGQDPEESDYRFFLGNTAKVHFFGIRSLLLYLWETQQQIVQGIEPLLLFSFLAPDVEASNVHRIQILLGCNIYFHPKVRFRLNSNLNLTNNRVNPDEYVMNESKFTVELQLRW